MRHDPDLTDTSFDILSMVALFLVPRLFSMFSLNSYVCLSMFLEPVRHKC